MKDLHILMVENDQIFADIHARKLQGADFCVIHVTHGDEALRRLESDVPDLVLLAIGLSPQDGFQILEAIRKSENGKSIPVIMLSRLSAKEDIDRAFALGATDYMIKCQHSPEDVLEVVCKRLGL